MWTRLGIGWVGLILNELYAGQDRVVHILRRAVSGGEKGQATMSCIWGSNVIQPDFGIPGFVSFKLCDL